MHKPANDDITAQLQFHHNRQHALCDALEQIADALPHGANKQACLVVSRSVFPTVRMAHEFEEKTLFPHLQAVMGQDENLEHSLERLRFEHWEDESFAEELSECLREFATSDQPGLSDKLSYMLRGFFEGLKRHMAFETEHLLPLLKANPTLETRRA